MPGAETVDPASLATLRRLLTMLVAFGAFAIAVDLVLLEHYEEWWQFAPIAVLGGAMTTAAWLVLQPRRGAVRAMRAMMVLAIAAGITGVWLHAQGSREFQHEIDPSLSGLSLFVTVIRAKAPPALAPGAMIQLGLLGLLSTWRHPAIRR